MTDRCTHCHLPLSRHAQQPTHVPGAIAAMVMLCPVGFTTAWQAPVRLPKAERKQEAAE